MEFANVIIPLSLDGVFTYHIPKELQNHIQIGQRVVVPFGDKKLYTGIVENIHNKKPELYKTKEIYSLLEDYPLVTPKLIEFWKWIADYYICALGDVYRNAFPTALKLESETFIRKTTQNIPWEELDEKETFIMQSLEIKTSINLKEIEAFLAKKYIIPSIKVLYDKRLIEIDELIIEKYKPKKVTYLRLNPQFEDSEKFKNALVNINRAEKQREALLLFIKMQQQRATFIQKKELIDESSPSVVKSLIEKNYLQEFQLQKDRLDEYDDHIEDSYVLSLAQQQALKEIENQFNTYSTVLLYGVTSSGKTELYFQLIEKQIKNYRN